MTISSHDTVAPSTLAHPLTGSLLIGALVFVIAVATRLAHLDAVPFYDELYHLLAARSWQDTGLPDIAGGSYTRGAFYTRLTAWMFDLTGSTDAFTARLFNVPLGALLAALTVVWTDRVAGRTAAIAAALLVLFWPSGIHLSQFIRFYALHGVVFFLGAIATFALFRPGQSGLYRLGMAVLAAGLLWTALQFQESTMVGVLCLLVWIGLTVILPAIWRSRYRWLLLGGLALMLLGLVATAFQLGIVQGLWVEYRESPWKMDPTGYNRVLRDTYPLLWPLTPLLAIAALRHRPRPAGFCLVISVLGLVIHSFAGVQNIRYIYYFSPFLFALWAIGVQAVLPAVMGATRRMAGELVGPGAGRILANGIIGFAVFFAIATNAAVPRSIKLALGGQAAPFVPRLSWAAAHDRVAELRQAGAIVVTHNDLYAIEFLGGLDVTYSQNWLPEMGGIEFFVDPRTGAPLISKPASLETVVTCSPEGVFVTDRLWSPPEGYIAFFGAFRQPDVSLIVEKIGPVDLLHWKTAPTAAQETDACAAVRPAG